MSIIGVDEVGRGALAGPVVVAAVILPSNFTTKGRRFSVPLKDSKKLTPRSRELWFEYVKNRAEILYATSRVYPRRIERINISKAANVAASRALGILERKSGFGVKDYKILMDGGLYLAKNLKSKPKEIRTIIRGDEKFNAIKLASIVAKVTRDRYMVKLHKDYPVYKFNLHKGYGTKDHIRAVRRHGPCDVHRLTFLTKYTKIDERAQSSKFKTKRK
ncbi:MAG: ribonuclease HII [Candidatus Colwellbacteria bacterium]|nr:ribonuclease HII [Candidatus Colwellbacteria bacterium]